MIGHDVDDAVAELAPDVAGELLAAAGAGGLESAFRQSVVTILESAKTRVTSRLLERGIVSQLELAPRDEYLLARGRADSVYNRFVIEYKRPGFLRASGDAMENKKVLVQLQTYIEDIARAENREVSRFAGVATDGFFFLFVRQVGNRWVNEEPQPVEAESTTRFLRLLFALSTGAALIPENLVADFGPRSERARSAIGALYGALVASQDPLVIKLYEQWSRFFAQASDYSAWTDLVHRKNDVRGFLSPFGLDARSVDAPRALFVLHTYYALLIKLIASMATAHFSARKAAPLTELAALDTSAFRDSLAYLERGGLYRDLGITNFLEGDFFGWYLRAWTPSVDSAARQLVARMAEYDPGSLELAPETARDLLKKLYHTLLPRQVRHTLGEYYTPDWLAERLIRQTLTSATGDSQVRVLDPACGSGTFLVLLVKHIRERDRRANIDPVATLHRILNNVIGIDLNPLAVTAARTNYLLALGDLLRQRTGPIDIPVYQADSILTPDYLRRTQSALSPTFEFEGDSYTLGTAVGEFRIPALFARRERMDALADALDEAIHTEATEDTFLSRVSLAANISQAEFVSVQPDLLNLLRQLTALHAQGLDGVWARIIKNAFAPMFLEPFDFVIGNPPWVNWEHLPDDYRTSMIPAWRHYGLFPHSGMDTILGKGKKDISMLMTCVVVDRYLKRGGRLGFVLSQSLFKTAGAGQGFRRFLLPDGTEFGPMAVEDMVALMPFEGATNRTVIGIFAKGKPVRYPVSYSKWTSAMLPKRRSIPFDSSYEEVTADKGITARQWQAEPVDSTDPTSPWMAARPKALGALRKVLGASAYAARAGAFTGGANAVFWLEVSADNNDLVLARNLTAGARRQVESSEVTLESSLVYPLLRGRDVQRWQALPSAHILITQDAARRVGISARAMHEKYPHAERYLAMHKDVLASRAAYKRYFNPADPYWSMFNVGEYTFMAWKVVWREQAATLTAAVVGSDAGQPVVPDHKLMLVAVASEMEAHYLCASLNSAPARLLVASYSVEIQMDTHILTHVSIPRFDANNPAHTQLAALSKQATALARPEDKMALARVQTDVDDAAAALWGLSKSELVDINLSLMDV